MAQKEHWIGSSRQCKEERFIRDCVYDFFVTGDLTRTNFFFKFQLSKLSKACYINRNEHTMYFCTMGRIVISVEIGRIVHLTDYAVLSC